jgi:hypothetical protein
MAERERFANITTNATTVVKNGGPGSLVRIVVNNAGTAWVITVYDNTAGSGTKIATITATVVGDLDYGIEFATGLTIVTSGTTPGDLTVVYE